METDTVEEIARLRRNEALYLASLEALDEGSCLFERLPVRPDGLRDYRYIWMNTSMQTMFGIADLSGQSIRDTFPNEAEAWYDDYDHVLLTGEPLRLIRESEPQEMVIEMSVTRVEQADAPVLLAVMRDVTARVRAEKALSRSQRLEAVARLSGTVAHDFNNLLLVVLSNIEMAGMMGVTPEQREYLSAAMHMVKIGGKLSKRLLGSSAHDWPVARKLDLNPVIRDMAEILERTLVLGFDLKLDISSRPAMIRADPAEIDAVLLNLVMNARDATPPGGPITIGTEIATVPGRTGRYVCLSVTDFGAGMTEEVRARACDPFFTTRPQGAGLGLFSASETARKNGGFLELQSTEEKGTTVRVCFPFNGSTGPDVQAGASDRRSRCI
ncbi:Blue-light-activated protein (plasmid) [Paracoccaceae bacterium]|nr:Blue-light-activated protein [Paracoccaceae bacterium]